MQSRLIRSSLPGSKRGFFTRPVGPLKETQQSWSNQEAGAAPMEKVDVVGV